MEALSVEALVAGAGAVHSEKDAHRKEKTNEERDDAPFPLIANLRLRWTRHYHLNELLDGWMDGLIYICLSLQQET